MDLPAGVIQFSVQLPALTFGQRSSVRATVHSLLSANRRIVGAQARRLTPGELIVLSARLDSIALIFQSLIHRGVRVGCSRRRRLCRRRDGTHGHAEYE